MIDSLTIGNFKAFGTPQTVPIKPITLIFGANSAGKSSILHSLLFAHEAARTGDLDVRHTQLGGESVDLGGFSQLTYRRDPANAVVLSFHAEKLPQVGSHALGLENVEIRATLQMDESHLKEVDDTLQNRIAELKKGDDDPEFASEVAYRAWEMAIEKYVGSSDQGAKFSAMLSGDTETNFRPLPVLRRFELLTGGKTILQASRRADSKLRIDRFDTSHPAFREVITAMLLQNTTTEAVNANDIELINKEIDALLPGIDLESGGILCRAPRKSGSFPTVDPRFAAIPKGSRAEELQKLVGVFFPPFVSRVFEAASKTIENFLKNLHYLGPLRAYPPRHITLDSLGDEGASEGLDAWKVVLKDPEVRRKVNAWLSSEFMQSKYELGLNANVPAHLVSEGLENGVAQLLEDLQAEFEEEDEVDGEKTSPIANISPEDLLRKLQRSILDRCGQDNSRGELTLRDRATGTLVSHRDIGIGVSQLLPVLVKAYASKESVIAIEQPEIHLHPALQAELADVFIDSALGEQKNTYILETHSEHLILRLLRRIRQTAENQLPAGKTPIRPEDVAILYVKPNKDGSRVVCLPPNSEGDFDHQWPDGFFEERAKELF
jgi:AAA ATPase domain